MTLKLLERHGYKVQSNWPISDMYVPLSTLLMQGNCAPFTWCRTGSQSVAIPAETLAASKRRAARRAATKRQRGARSRHAGAPLNFPRRRQPGSAHYEYCESTIGSVLTKVVDRTGIRLAARLFRASTGPAQCDRPEFLVRQSDL